MNNLNMKNKNGLIVIAEDSLTQSAKLDYLLTSEGYSVITTSNGKLALDEVKNRKVELVISDIMMPEMNGYELCKAIKEDEKLFKIPVLLLTSFTESENLFSSLGAGADFFITKPYKDEVFLKKVAYILSSLPKKDSTILESEKKLEQLEKLLETKSGRLIALNFFESTFDYLKDQNELLSEAEETLSDLNSNLIIEISTRKKIENKVKGLNVHLNKNLIEIESINKELKSFGYSVSHDLRAPLRAIGGFSKILLEDFSSTLDVEGKRYLNKIIDSTKNMGQLIDDLLAFSRFSRIKMQFSKINMFALATAIYEEFAHQTDTSNIEFKMENIPDAYADLSMTKQVLRNLIGNAIKYSSQKTSRIIEVGCTVESDENIYFIKDNGIGFNMDYEEKLFGVFQRLHSVKEFEGTGVGLAIVKRIIHRFGGRVWAVGKENEGAIFYFSLLNKIK